MLELINEERYDADARWRLAAGTWLLEHGFITVHNNVLGQRGIGNGGSSQMSSQREIARALGVSQISVSRALNDDPRVRAELKERVLAEAVTSGYVKNRVASSFKQGATQLIGLLIPRINCSFFPDIAGLMDGLARDIGYHIMMAYTNEDGGKTSSEIRLMLEMRVDGMIIAPPCGACRDAFDLLRVRGVPLVCLDRYVRGYPCDHVVTDNLLGGRLAARHLLELGHTRIAHIRGPRRTSSSDEIYRGFRQTLRAAGVTVNPEWMPGNGFEEADGWDAAERLLALKDRPTALFAVNDTMAIGAIRRLEAAGVSVPDDIAVVGYSDIRVSSLLRVPLTTIREDVELLARNAFELLLQSIQSGNHPLRKIRVPPELVIRASSGDCVRGPSRAAGVPTGRDAGA